MSHRAPVGWLDVTTNQQLLALEGRMSARFEAVDARCDAFAERMDARIEAVDERFDAFAERVDARFKAVDTRLDALAERVDARFEVVGARFERLEERIDARFETADAKLDVLRHDFGEQLALGLRDQLRVLVFRFVACMLTFASVVIAALKL